MTMSPTTSRLKLVVSLVSRSVESLPTLLSGGFNCATYPKSVGLPIPDATWNDEVLFFFWRRAEAVARCPMEIYKCSAGYSQV